MSEKNKPVCFEPELNQLYWIEWKKTGNNDIPHRHYITPNIASNIASNIATNTLTKDTQSQDIANKTAKIDPQNNPQNIASKKLATALEEIRRHCPSDASEIYKIATIALNEWQPGIKNERS